PSRLFGRDLGSLRARFDVLFHVVSDDRPGVRVTPGDPAAVAGRMAASLQYERLPLRAAYDQFRYAFPGVRNPHLDGAEAVEAERLRQVLAAKPAFVVSHPYPVRLAELHAAMDAHLGGEGAA